MLINVEGATHMQICTASCLATVEAITSL